MQASVMTVPPMSTSMSTPAAGTEPIPPARVDFTAEDRMWIAERIQEVLESGRLTLGRYGQAFEEAFAELCGARYAIAVNSGTAALEIILRAIGVAGTDVLVPANTFFATAAAIVNAGGRPLLMDTDPDTLGTSPEEVEGRLTPATSAVVVVHIGGLVSPQMPAIRAFCDRRGVHLVEDAAHAHGARFGRHHAGTFGIAGAFSFYPTKVMTSAEGGMIVTDDPKIDAEARIYRDQGKASFTQNAHVRLGYNWRMSEPHAIIGLRHLQRLPEMLAARRRIATLYDEHLTGVAGLRLLPLPAECKPNYYKYIAYLDDAFDRSAVKRRLRDEHAVSLSGEVYELPLHRNPVFAALDPGDLSNAERICARHICLPVFASMTDAQVERVASALATVLAS